MTPDDQGDLRHETDKTPLFDLCNGSTDSDFGDGDAKVATAIAGDVDHAASVVILDDGKSSWPTEKRYLSMNNA